MIGFLNFLELARRVNKWVVEQAKPELSLAKQQEWQILCDHDMDSTFQLLNIKSLVVNGEVLDVDTNKNTKAIITYLNQ